MVKQVETIFKLDKDSLNKALRVQAQQLQKEYQDEKDFLSFIAKFPAANDPDCKLTDDGVRLWNDENTNPASTNES